jgi:D-arginine dehydrogenase
VRRVAHRWAGLRSFLPDRTPAIGYDQSADGFFWLAGQGGFGLQTSPAVAEIAAALIHGDKLPDGFGPLNITPDLFAPGRFHT